MYICMYAHKHTHTHYYFYYFYYFPSSTAGGGHFRRLGAELELRRCGSSLGPSKYRLASTRRQPASSLPRSGHWAPNLGPM